MNKDFYRAPTIRELYALEKRARQERALAVAAGFTWAASALKFVSERALSVLAAKVVRHA